jgi:Glycosyl hydrolase family 1
LHGWFRLCWDLAHLLVHSGPGRCHWDIAVVNAIPFHFAILKVFWFAFHRHKLEPVVTLHHFVHPQWFENLGGFTKEENITHFVRFAEFAYRCALQEELLIFHLLDINIPHSRRLIKLRKYLVQ